jgi:hypothetical protein
MVGLESEDNRMGRVYGNVRVASSGAKLINVGRIRLLTFIGLPLLLICRSALGQHMNAKDAPCQGPS